MRKQYFWAIQKNHDEGTCLIMRFRTEGERDSWVDNFAFAPVIVGIKDVERHPVAGTDPEVRRIKRRIAAGEAIQFPVEID